MKTSAVTVWVEATAKLESVIGRKAVPLPTAYALEVAEVGTWIASGPLTKLVVEPAGGEVTVVARVSKLEEDVVRRPDVNVRPEVAVRVKPPPASVTPFEFEIATLATLLPEGISTPVVRATLSCE